MKRTIILVFAAVLIAGAAIACGRDGGRGSLVRELAGSTPERTFAARTSIGSEYHECTQPSAKGDGLVPREKCAEPAEGPLKPRTMEAARESADPDSLQAWALATVIWGDDTDTEALMYDAILRLDTALRLSPGSVPLLVDLSVAHLVRAERTQNSRDLWQALNYAEEALAREPGNHAALFNAALALQAWGLDREADEAWSAYLAADPTSEWADEARRRKERLIKHIAQIPRPAPGAPDSVVQAFAANHPQEARELGWDDVLGKWGKAVEAGNPARADSLLDFAEGLGRALERRPGGDASLAAAVRAIRAAAGDTTAMLALALAHQAYVNGRANILAPKYEEAGQAFVRVVSLQPRSDVLVQWTTVFLAELGAYETQTEARLSRLLADVDSRHPALAGRTRRAFGRKFLRDGKYSEAHEQFSAAQKLFGGAGETEMMADALSLQGEAAYERGDSTEAYQLMHHAHEGLEPRARSRALHIHLMALAMRATQDEMPRAGLAVYDESVRAAERLGVDFDVLEALQYRARARAIVGDSIGAARDLGSAMSRLAGIPPGTLRNQARANIRVASRQKLTAAAMDSTIETLSDNMLWLIPALLWRADEELAGDNLPAAIRYLDSATARVRGLSSKETHIRHRAAMIEQVRKRLDQLVMLHLADGRIEDALRVLERGRVSFAPQRDSMQARAAARFMASPGQTVVDYALIGDTLVAWLLRANSPVEVFKRPVDRDTFRLTVEQVGTALEAGADAEGVRPNLQHLYEWLIGPIRTRLGPANTLLVIVADGEVAGVPFEALWDSAGRRYLVEDHPLRFAATLADAALPLPPARTRSGLALLVADPAFDQVRHYMLERLPGARTELDSVARFYPGAGVLREDNAARDTFIALAQRAGIIHYAGHAVFNDARPERSFLLLAGVDTTGQLTAEAVDSIKLRGAPLVVLSACRTLRSREGRSGGLAGLSGSLLTAGASGVVGSLWQADDDLTQPLMVAFHRHYQGLGDPARALREAQREMIGRPDPRLSSPAAWAGFRYMGN